MSDRTADSTALSDAAKAVARSPITKVVGFLICVELASGVLQGYYTPIFTDIARHLSIKDADVNWFEAAQLIVSALVVPLLARLGDLIGHRKVLLLSTVVTAIASWGVAFAPSFGLFLVAWALQGFYVVWLPMEVAIIHRRTGGAESRVRGAAGLLVAGLELGVIVGALTSGALAETLGMTALLAVPAVVVTLALLAIWFGVEETPVLVHGRVDWHGFSLITLVLGLVMAGLVMLRVFGPGSPWPWLLVVAGLVALVPFARVELAHPEPLVDLRVLGAPGQWPVQATAFLFGVSVLGAQIPLSTFARTDPAVTGYGLGASASRVSIIIGGYVLSLAIGALLLHVVGRRTGTRPRHGRCRRARGHRLPALPALPRHARTDDDEHGDRRAGLRGARRGPAHGRRGRGAPDPHRPHDRHDQHDEDDRRRLRLECLRHRSRLRRHRRRRGDGARLAGGLPDRLGHLRRHRAHRGGLPRGRPTSQRRDAPRA